MSCGIGRRHSSDPALLWLWCEPVATAQIRPLAWETPNATGVALEKIKKKKKKDRYTVNILVTLASMCISMSAFPTFHRPKYKLVY